MYIMQELEEVKHLRAINIETYLYIKTIGTKLTTEKLSFHSQYIQDNQSMDI